MDYIETFAITLQFIGDILSTIPMSVSHCPTTAPPTASTTAPPTASTTAPLKASSSPMIRNQPECHANQLRLWEDFINDGREIASIAQIIEAKYKYNRFPAAAIDFLFHTLNITVDLHLRPGSYILELFKYHANLKRIRVCEAVELWLPKFEKVFPQAAIQDLYSLHKDTYWDWE